MTFEIAAFPLVQTKIVDSTIHWFISDSESP